MIGGGQPFIALQVTAILRIGPISFTATRVERCILAVKLVGQDQIRWHGENVGRHESGENICFVRNYIGHGDTDAIAYRLHDRMVPSY